MDTNKLNKLWNSHRNERWKKVTTKFPTKTCDYYISDHGRAKSVDKVTKKENFLKGSTLPSGHHTLNLRLKGNKNQHIYIHKFVAEQFIEKDSEDQCFAVHIDGDKANNHWENIAWKNQKELTEFQFKNGSFIKRSLNPLNHVKMTEEKVRLLKKRIKEGRTKKKILAKSFGITTMQLNRIERGENWGHVKLEEEEEAPKKVTSTFIFKKNRTRK